VIHPAGREVYWLCARPPAVRLGRRDVRCQHEGRLGHSVKHSPGDTCADDSFSFFLSFSSSSSSSFFFFFDYVFDKSVFHSAGFRTACQYVVLVEKECTYTRLVDEEFSLRNNCILLTVPFDSLFSFFFFSCSSFVLTCVLIFRVKGILA
jgi:hypothetical protein